MLLSRFQVLIDYQMGKMWFKPSKDYEKAFEFDRSGLNIIASGLHLNTFTVQAVMQNSPALEADFRKGDEILRVGATPTALLSLSDILKTFQKSPGKKIKVVIRRDGKKIKKVLVLRDLL
jgi:C-terminal processing protease CtpA/Prc